MKIECPNSLKVDKIRDGIMFFHASSKPRTSNHGIPLIYFFKKKENVLTYLSNAVKQICKGVPDVFIMLMKLLILSLNFKYHMP